VLTSIAPVTYVGLDVHQNSISIALLRPGAQTADEDEIPNTAEAVCKLVRRWKDRGAVRVCYEAGPTGYGLQRTFASLGVDCAVIAPALIPVRPGVRIKTDRRDARKLAGLFRAGELTTIRIPPPEEEAVRDLIRAREDLCEDILRARHRLSKFLLRHDRVYREGTQKWTERHLAWVRRQQFATPGLEALVGHHLAIIEARVRQRDLMDAAIAQIAADEPYVAPVRRLCCLRGIRALSALTLLVEVGDFRRFAGAAAFMGFTGLVPSEASSGERQHHGSITKTGNAHLRRVLVEAAWAYRAKPALGASWRTRFADQPAELVAYAIAAQQRLHARYWRMTNRGKLSSVATVAVARELAGFIWGVMNERWA
jgi:transposase